MGVSEIGWQLQFIILPIVFGSIVLLAGIGMVLGSVFGDGSDGVAAPLSGIFGGVLATVVGVLWVVLLVPFDSKYQVLYAVDGTVASVDAPFTEDGGDTLNSYLVTLEGDDRIYRLTDPRAKRLTGDIALTCSIEWVYQGADRINCVIAGGVR